MTRLFKYIYLFITNPQKRFAYLSKAKITHMMSDEKWVKRWYYYKTGELISFDNPKNFNEKIQWYKVFYRNDKMTQICDKVLVRNYVKEKGFEKLLKKQYGVYDSFEKIPFDDMPDVFYIKTNHSSGTNRIVQKNMMVESDKQKLRKYFNKELKKNYFWNTREWAYKNITPQIICEEYLESKDGKPLLDINLFCFAGKVKLIYINTDLADKEGKHAKGKRAVFDSNMNYISEAKTQMECLKEQDCIIPHNMDEIITVAETLSEDFPHVRVDFFYINGKIYFGEMTFYSAAGYMELQPQSLMDELNDCFELKYR